MKKIKDLEYNKWYPVEEYFKNDFSGHDFYHTLRVFNLAREISKVEKGDSEIIELAALLHDVDDYKLVGEQEELFKNVVKFVFCLFK